MMTRENLPFLTKVLVLSLAISVAIKYIVPAFSLPPTAVVSLILVLLPAGLVGLRLGLSFLSQQR